jgi:hypothetical protein
MDVRALTVEAVRDGPVRTLLLRGDLDLSEAGGFLAQAQSRPLGPLPLANHTVGRPGSAR